MSVSGGVLSATVPARSAIAIHTGQLLSTVPSPTVFVTFQETATTVFGEVSANALLLQTEILRLVHDEQNIFLVGSISQLGSWAPASSVGHGIENYIENRW